MADRHDKTEKPTARRKKQARKEGRVARSQEIGTWLALLLAPILLRLVVHRGTSLCQNLMTQVAVLVSKPDTASALKLFRTGMTGALTTAMPVMFGLLGIGLLSSAAQGGVHVSFHPLKPKFERLNPLSGLKKTFGIQGAWNAAKVVAKTAVLALLVYRSLSGVIPQLMQPGLMPLSAVLGTAGNAATQLVTSVAGAGLVLALADYAWARRTVMRGLMMTKQEVKDEHRQQEGDPHVKQSIRSRQLAISRNRMILDVAKADVVLVNPTHVAVALKYSPSQGAPRVLAKGRGEVAAKIRDQATTHRVPIVHDPPLARSLYAACEVGAEIPVELYGAVAKVLAFLYALRVRGRSTAGVHTNLALPRPA